MRVGESFPVSLFSQNASIIRLHFFTNRIKAKWEAASRLTWLRCGLEWLPVNAGMQYGDEIL